MPTRIRSLTVGLLSAAFIYCLLGFLVVPGIALHMLNDQMEQRLNVPARLKGLEFNPFNLELNLHQLEIGPPQERLLRLRRLDANLQISSLWSDALELESLTIERVEIAATLLESGQLDLSRILKTPPQSTGPAEEAPGTLFPVRIARLKVRESRLQFDDQRPSTPVQINLASIQVDAQAFSTLKNEHTTLSLQARGPAESRLQFHGTVTARPLSLAGSLTLDSLPLLPVWPYARDRLGVQLQDGRLDVHAEVLLNLSPEVDLRLDNTRGTLSSLVVTSPRGDPLAQLARLHLEDIHFDLIRRSVRVGMVRSRQLESWVSRTENGELNWQAFLPSTPDRGQAEQNARWRIRLPDVELRGYRVNLVDQQPATPTAVTLSSLDLDIHGLDTASAESFDLRIDTHLNQHGRLAVRGQVRLEPTTFDLAVSAERLDLRLAQAYLEPYVRMNIRSGLLSTSADVRLEALEPLALKLDGEADITDLHIIDAVENRDLVRWKHLELEDIAYRPDSVTVAKANLLEPYARIIINQDLTTNLGDLIIRQPDPAQEAERPGLAMRIGAIDIDQGSLNFADFSLQPNVALTLEELSGRVGTLDNRSTAPAEINLSGQVDRYAPARVVGTLTPFDPLNSLDVEASFRDIELTTLSPYARKFAGYRIRKGRLDLDLHYQITAGELLAENKVLLRDLQLGERVESPDAVDLPVRLAIALLKDAQGNIDITLPVRGDLSNPDFDVMPLIWQTLGNLLTRAATAPFRFIANLIGNSDTDLSQVHFAPGSIELDDQARQRLDGLARALKDRPGLRLEVEGMSAPAAEGHLVAEQRLERELNRRWNRMLDPDEGAAVNRRDIPDETLPGLLEAIYLDRVQQEVPEEWMALEPGPKAAHMRQAILETWNANEALLRRLAQQRNQNIKAYLVDTAGLPAQRVQLLDVGVEAVAGNGEVPTLLHLGVD